jgi:hypothetical protein
MQQRIIDDEIAGIADKSHAESNNSINATLKSIENYDMSSKDTYIRELINKAYWRRYKLCEELECLK